MMRRIAALAIVLTLAMPVVSMGGHILRDDAAAAPLRHLASTLSGRSVCIDPGRGGGRLGAVGMDGTGYPDEKDITLDIGLRLRDLLEAGGATVHMTRIDDSAPSLQDRVDTANANGDDIFVSIHTASNDSYDRARAVEYSDTWWDGRNPAYNDYSSSGGDCADFVSQCLNAGTRCLEAGRTGGTGDGVDGWGCIPFCDYLHENLVTYQGASWTYIENGSGSPPADLRAGDVIIYGDASPGDLWRHAAFVVGGQGDTAIVNAHSTDRYHQPWDYAYPGTFQRVNFYRLPDTTGLSPGEDHGVRTFYWGDASSYSASGRKLAYAIQGECSDQLGLANLTAKRDAVWFGYHRFVLQKTTMPGVIVEPGFITDNAEFNMLNDSAFRQDTARAIFDGILRYFRTGHAPFRIDSDADLSAAASGEGWPGNGTAASPYIIEGYDINGTGSGCCIYIGNTTAHLVVRDCSLHRASGREAEYYWNTGLYMLNVTNARVENVSAYLNGRYGIRLQDSDGDLLESNEAHLNGYYGIYLRYSDGNRVLSNTCDSNYYSGVVLYYSNNNTAADNTLRYNENYGVYLEGCVDTGLSANRILDSTHYGIYALNSRVCNITGNEVRGQDKEGIYLLNGDNNTISGNTVRHSGECGIELGSGSLGNVVSGNDVSDASLYGIQVGDDFGGADHNDVNNNTVNDTAFFGIYILKSGSVEVHGNTVFHNGEFGIYAKLSQYLDIHHNLAHDNVYGICLRYSTHNTTIRDNTCRSNNRFASEYITAGISVEYGSPDNTIVRNSVHNQSTYNGTGVLVQESAGSIVEGNNISGNIYGAYLYDANLTRFRENDVSGNHLGVFLDEFCTNNTVTGNNFLGNDIQANDSSGSRNSWDAGYPAGGNYWDDLSGPDYYHGPSQDIAGSDGFVDLPYTGILNTTSIDRYPLAGPFERTEITVPLQPGWNLVSLPLRQSNWSIGHVLASISGDWDRIYAYNVTGPDTWKSFSAAKPPGLNDLGAMNHLHGYWLRCNTTADLTVSGDMFDSGVSVPLGAGWNLVGYPSMNGRTADQALAGTGADMIAIYNATAPYLLEDRTDLATVTMQPGEGYWIHVPADTTWTVDW